MRVNIILIHRTARLDETVYSCKSCVHPCLQSRIGSIVYPTRFHTNNCFYCMNVLEEFHPKEWYFDLQCQDLIPVLHEWAARASYTTASPVVTQFPGHTCMDRLSTERSVDSQASLVIHIFGSFYSFDMSSIGVCITRHWQMSGCLLQKLNYINSEQ